MSIRAMPVAMLLMVTAGLAACDKAEQEQPQIPRVTYVHDVDPIIQTHCVVCHMAGRQGAMESGLLMDSYESLMKGSSFGPVINPGSAMTSSLYVLLTGKARLTVSMPHGKEPLTANEIETIRAWIEGGALEN